MFTVNNLKTQNKNYVILQNADKSSTAKISLNEGGSLTNLKLNNTILIKEIENFDYKNSYASSVLFPFASRIENGKYAFNDKEFVLKCNDSDKNALHGLVYDKTFTVLNSVEDKNYVSVIISYKETKNSIGFPYKYNIELTYTLYKNELTLSVKIKNLDDKTFPFTLGWHPYFLCDDLQKSYLKFKSNQSIQFDKNLITDKVIDKIIDREFIIANKQLDDCFILKSDLVGFFTPNYQIEITTNQVENYLQLYTPKNLPLIAIEPMTGISNSFNNKICLQNLAPNQQHTVKWNVKLID